MPANPATIGAALAAGRCLLGATSDPAAGLDAELLLGHVLGRSRIGLWAHPDQAVPAAAGRRYLALLRRRRAGEPVAYLLGRREFWSMDLVVDPRVLIPRPETEHLVEALLQRLPADARRVIDFGTGSGCVALAVARERLRTLVVGVDRDAGALAVAALNVRRHGLGARVKLVQAATLAAVAGPGRVDAVVSNPPYIPAHELATLPPTVRQHEPLAALVGGRDGLAVIRPLVAEAGRLLRDGGWLALEVAAGGAAATRALLGESLWEEVQVVPDLAGLPRVVVGRRRRAQKPTPRARSLLRARRASSVCG